MKWVILSMSLMLMLLCGGNGVRDTHSTTMVCTSFTLLPVVVVTHPNAAPTPVITSEPTIPANVPSTLTAPSVPTRFAGHD